MIRFFSTACALVTLSVSLSACSPANSDKGGIDFPIDVEYYFNLNGNCETIDSINADSIYKLNQFFSENGYYTVTPHTLDLIAYYKFLDSGAVLENDLAWVSDFELEAFFENDTKKFFTSMDYVCGSDSSHFQQLCRIINKNNLIVLSKKPIAGVEYLPPIDVMGRRLFLQNHTLEVLLESIHLSSRRVVYTDLFVSIAKDDEYNIPYRIQAIYSLYPSGSEKFYIARFEFDDGPPLHLVNWYRESGALLCDQEFYPEGVPRG